MARKSTIGANPLDAVVPRTPGAPPTPHPAPHRVPKERVTFQLPLALIERARNTVYWTPGATVAGLMEDALTAHLAHIEQQRGAPFPPREQALKTGRPLK
ncbi:MAG: hypothetical protein AB7N91_28540 [Candidatus Tectimicrobiota bacterium]